MSTARLGIRVLLISMDVTAAEQTARMLDQLGYEVEHCEPASLLAQCCGRAPDAIVLAAMEQQAPQVDDALRAVRQLQQEGRLPDFPVIAAGRPEGDAAQHLVDGIVLEPERLISLATELSKQVAGDQMVQPVPLPPSADEETE